MPSGVEESLNLFCAEFFHRRAGTEQISIAVNIVDSGNGRPELVFACPGRGKGRFFARVRVVPFLRRDLSRRVRCVLDRIIFAIDLAFHDRLDLGVD